MIFKNSFGSIDLQRFSDAAGSGEAGEGSAGVNAASAQPQSGDKVIYGKQSEAVQPAAGADSQADNADNSGKGEDKEESFEALIGGKFKNEFNERVSGIVQRRLSEKNGSRMQEDAFIRRMCDRYGAKDLTELESYFNSEEAVEGAALAQGMNPDTYLELERLRGENKSMKEMQQRMQQAAAAQQQYEAWTNEAEKVKEIYKDFDLDAELKNPQFRGLIMTKNPQYSISMLEAYRIAHFDEISQAAEAIAAEKVAQSVSASASRPAENGLGTGSGVIVKSDVSSFTKKDRQEIARRVARGEKIVL